MYAFCNWGAAFAFGFIALVVRATLQLATGAAGSAWFIVVGSSLVHHCLFIVGVSSVYDWFTFGLLWFIIGSSLVVRIISSSIVGAGSIYRCSSLNQ